MKRKKFNYIEEGTWGKPSDTFIEVRKEGKIGWFKRKGTDREVPIHYSSLVEMPTSIWSSIKRMLCRAFECQDK